MKYFTCQPDSHNGFVSLCDCVMTYFSVEDVGGDKQQQQQQQQEQQEQQEQPPQCGRGPLGGSSGSSGTHAPDGRGEKSRSGIRIEHVVTLPECFRARRTYFGLSNRSVLQGRDMAFVGTSSGLLALVVVTERRIVYAANKDPPSIRSRRAAAAAVGTANSTSNATMASPTLVGAAAAGAAAATASKASLPASPWRDMEELPFASVTGADGECPSTITWMRDQSMVLVGYSGGTVEWYSITLACEAGGGRDGERSADDAATASAAAAAHGARKKRAKRKEKHKKSGSSGADAEGHAVVAPFPLAADRVQPGAALHRLTQPDPESTAVRDEHYGGSGGGLHVTLAGRFTLKDSGALVTSDYYPWLGCVAVGAERGLYLFSSSNLQQPLLVVPTPGANSFLYCHPLLPFVGVLSYGDEFSTPSSPVTAAGGHHQQQPWPAASTTSASTSAAASGSTAGCVVRIWRITERTGGSQYKSHSALSGAGISTATTAASSAATRLSALLSFQTSLLPTESARAAPYYSFTWKFSTRLELTVCNIDDGVVVVLCLSAAAASSVAVMSTSRIDNGNNNNHKDNNNIRSGNSPTSQVGTTANDSSGMNIPEKFDLQRKRLVRLPLINSLLNVEYISAATFSISSAPTGTAKATAVTATANAATVPTHIARGGERRVDTASPSVSASVTGEPPYGSTLSWQRQQLRGGAYLPRGDALSVAAKAEEAEDERFAYSSLFRTKVHGYTEEYYENEVYTHRMYRHDGGGGGPYRSSRLRPRPVTLREDAIAADMLREYVSKQSTLFNAARQRQHAGSDVSELSSVAAGGGEDTEYQGPVEVTTNAAAAAAAAASHCATDYRTHVMSDLATTASVRKGATSGGDVARGTRASAAVHARRADVRGEATVTAGLGPFSTIVGVSPSGEITTAPLEVDAAVGTWWGDDGGGVLVGFGATAYAADVAPQRSVEWLMRHRERCGFGLSVARNERVMRSLPTSADTRCLELLFRYVASLERAGAVEGTGPVPGLLAWLQGNARQEMSVRRLVERGCLPAECVTAATPPHMRTDGRYQLALRVLQWCPDELSGEILSEVGCSASTYDVERAVAVLVTHRRVEEAAALLTRAQKLLPAYAAIAALLTHYAATRREAGGGVVHDTFLQSLSPWLRTAFLFLRHEHDPAELRTIYGNTLLPLWDRIALVLLLDPEHARTEAFATLLEGELLGGAGAVITTGAALQSLLLLDGVCRDSYALMAAVVDTSGDFQLGACLFARVAIHDLASISSPLSAPASSWTPQLSKFMASEPARDEDGRLWWRWARAYRAFLDGQQAFVGRTHFDMSCQRLLTHALDRHRRAPKGGGGGGAGGVEQHAQQQRVPEDSTPVSPRTSGDTLPSSRVRQRLSASQLPPPAPRLAGNEEEEEEAFATTLSVSGSSWRSARTLSNRARLATRAAVSVPSQGRRGESAKDVCACLGSHVELTVVEGLALPAFFYPAAQHIVAADAARCAVCLGPVNDAPAYALQANRDRDDTSVIQRHVRTDAVSWCATCQHGGHEEHLKQWFAAHDVCAVRGCRCRCSEDASLL